MSVGLALVTLDAFLWFGFVFAPLGKPIEVDLADVQYVSTASSKYLANMASGRGASPPLPPKISPVLHSSGGGHGASGNYNSTSSQAQSFECEIGSSAHYDLQFGFWHCAELAAQPDGDLNADDLSDALDVQEFTNLAVDGAAADPVQIERADFDCNGIVDGDDVQSFVTLLLFGRPPAGVLAISPFDYSDNVGIEADLAWIDAPRADSNVVYFGTMEDAVRTATPSDFEFQGITTTNGWLLGQLSPLTTYYWRIDTVNTAGHTTGVVWRFQTGS